MIGAYAFRNQRGFGLVEIMVAMVLGLLLIAAAIQVFLGSRASYRYNEGLATLQDNARFVAHTLARDVRQAGYTGCPAGVSVAPSVDGDRPFSALNIIASEAVDAGVSTDELLAPAIREPGNLLPERAMPGSDALLLTYMRDPGVRVSDGPTDNANIKITSNPAGWEAGDQLLVTNCVQADLFAATNVSNSEDTSYVTIAHSSTGNEHNRLSRIYSEHDRVMTPREVMYFIGDSGDTDDAGNPVQSLYRWEGSPTLAADDSTPDVLVDGITDLTVRYGLDTDGDGVPERYVAAGSVSEWDDAVAVRYAFVADSGERAGGGVGGGDDSLDLLGAAVDPPDDGHLRRVFSGTIAVRNRVP